MMKKPLEYNSIQNLREATKRYIQKKIKNNSKKINKISFIEENISITPVDYYYTNPIARSS